MAERACDVRKFGEAERFSAEALRVDPEMARAHATLGRAKIGHQQYLEADACFARSLQLDAEQTRCWRGRALCARRLGRFADALKFAESSVRLDPADSLSHCELGQCLAIHFRNDEAESHLVKAISLDPEDAWIHGIYADHLMGQSKLRRAEEVYLEALRLDASNPSLLNRLGELLQRQKRPVEAAKCFEYAISLDPTSSLTKANLVASVDSIRVPRDFVIVGLLGAFLVTLIVLANIDLGRSFDFHDWAGPIACVFVVLGMVLWVASQARQKKAQDNLKKNETSLLELEKLIRKHR